MQHVCNAMKKVKIHYWEKKTVSYSLKTYSLKYGIHYPIMISSQPIAWQGSKFVKI